MFLPIGETLLSVIVPNKATQTRTSVTMKPMHATEQMKSTMRGETQNPKSSHLTGNPYLSHRAALLAPWPARAAAATPDPHHPAKAHPMHVRHRRGLLEPFIASSGA